MITSNDTSPAAGGGSARPGSTGALAKRFYADAKVVEQDGRWAIALDGRLVRTPRQELFGLSQPLAAEAVAAEWRAQGAQIDPTTMPMTRIVNSAIDGVARDLPAVQADIARYASSDLLCYRADGPASLVAEQAAAWDPVLAWVREDLGAFFIMAEGIVFVEQPEQSLAAVRSAIDAVADPVVLACLHVMTTLTGSVILALAVLRGHLDAAAAWSAANVDEDFQWRAWGSDAEALERRARRWVEMDAAATLSRLLG